VLARHTDAIPGTDKVDIAERAVGLIDPHIITHRVRAELRSQEAFSNLMYADTLFGCLDNDGARLVLNEFALAYEKDYFDLASDVEQQGALRYGGRISLVGRGPGCLVCLGLINSAEARNDLENALGRNDRAAIYGVNGSLLDGAGPSVVSINGVVASLAVTEYMVAATGLREPRRNLTYRGDMGVVTSAPARMPSDCYFCNVVRGAGERAGVERFLH
jgi:hypothetical protein